MKIRIYTIAVLMLLCSSIYAQSPKATYGTFALTNASIQTVTKGVITNGTVVISKGKIIAVGTSLQIPQGAEVIDCKGQWIYPGMIDGGTRIGLFEFGL